MDAMTEQNQPAEPEPASKAVVLGQGPDGEMYVLTAPDGGAGDQPITEPGKVMRIGRMISRLLDEVKDAPLDEASRTRLREIYDQSIEELAGGLSEDLSQELHRIVLPFAQEAAPSDAELRIAQAQLVGWLEGLFQGLQTALVAHQLTARINDQSGQGLRVAIPQSDPGSSETSPTLGTGMYL